MYRRKRREREKEKKTNIYTMAIKTKKADFSLFMTL